MKKRLALLLLLSFSAARAWATAPTLTSVTISTTASNGSAFSWACSGCGTAPNNGKPDAWFPINGSGDGPSSLGRVTSWSTQQWVSAVSSNIPSGIGFASTVSHALKRDWSVCNQSNGFAGDFAVQPLTSGASVYSSVFRYTSEVNLNDKYWRYDCISAVGACNDVADAWNNGQGSEVFVTENDGLEAWSGRYGGFGAPTAATWYKEEMEFAMGAEHPAVESGTGYIKKLRSNKTIINSHTMPNGDAADLDELYIEEVKTADCPASNAATYFTDVKIWFTLYQIFISSASSGGTCSAITDGTRKSAQIPSSWTNTGGSGIMDLENVDTSNGVCVSVRNGDGEMSSPVLATANGGGPTSLSPSLGSPTTTSLVGSWTGVGGSATYIGALASDSGFTSIVATGTITSPNTYNSLSCNTQYWFEVKVSTEGDSSYTGNQTNATTSACAGNTNLASRVLSVNVSSFTVLWSSVPAASNNFIAVVSTASDFSRILTSGTLLNNVTSYASLSQRTTYYFEVKVATEGSYNSSISTVTRWTSLQPVGSIHANPALRQANFDWTSAGTNYHYAYSYTSDFSVIQSSFPNASGNNVGFGNQPSNTTIYFKVKVSTETDNAYETTSILTPGWDTVPKISIGGNTKVGGNVIIR